MYNFLLWFAFTMFGSALGWYFGFGFGYHAGWHEGRLKMLLGPAIKSKSPGMIGRKEEHGSE